MHSLTLSRPWLLLVLFLPAGCEVDYFAHLIAGQLASLGETVPIEEALQDARLTDEERAELALTQEVRQFGIDRIGLEAGDAFTVFEWNGSAPAAYIVSASAKDKLQPYIWCFPILGAWEAKGFFDEALAQREADRLATLDYDVFLGRASGFSTLGFLADPVRQSNLRELDKIDLAELIFHELLHSTVIKSSDIDFSESLGTFVGRTAAQMWFEERFGADSPEAQAARDRFADAAVIDEFVNELHARMSQYYDQAAGQGLPREVIVAGRELEFDDARVRYETVYRPRIVDQARWGPIGDAAFNNAMLVGAIRYQGSLSDYQAVLDKVGGSFPDAIWLFQQAAETDDPRAYLREWAAGH